VKTVRAARVVTRLAALGLLACGEPALPPITRLAIFTCGNADCTIHGDLLAGLPPKTGMFMVGAFFRGVHDVHWSIRWSADSVKADLTALQDSSVLGANLDGMLFEKPLVLTVVLLAGGRDSLTWDFR
jgi:hypothetical protein